ncbi:UbiH/UbiF family hydroxylase [Rhizobium sp. CG5]|uniref:UbiH/UbiF family hydroxylase n=1 Tax=Rhizobium sp. CG5 TaxID=2726076 RepID=UPI002034247C|nr:UbiH/UbiF family hydroxylase [Rhizobium sp. CG5]MCM2474774.1 UbiH/UbiF family hydroxylase [Rhizobium sp. CG5]
MRQFDIAVIGAGLAGSVAALAMARGGRSVVLVAGPRSGADGRTTALMDQSIGFMARLGLWDEIAPFAAGLSTMQIIDGTKRLLRAPPVSFRSAEIGIDAFGYNMANRDLMAVLEKALAQEPGVSLVQAEAQSLAFDDGGVTIALDSGETLFAAFVIGADGRNSKTRETAGVSVRRWSYPQSALVLNFAHTVPHHNVSTEFHTETGPFTQVPLPGQRSSLVWVVEPAEATRLAALPLEELSRLVETRMQSLLGKVSVEEGAQCWPLSGMTALRYGKGRAAFIGEAAHAFPPIGAQGLNLSLRDVMALEDILCADPQRPIAADAGDVFDRRRRVDVISRTASVDILNRSLLSSFLPVQMLRAAGLHLLKSVAPLRHLVMREGVEPGRGFGSFPALLREKIGRQASGRNGKEQAGYGQD